MKNNRIRFSEQEGECDCFPISLINGLKYVLPQGKIHRDHLAEIHRVCVDDDDGTSPAAVKYISERINSEWSKKYPIKSTFLENEKVSEHLNSRYLNDSGCLILKVTHGDGCHYILVHRIDREWVYGFDPLLSAVVLDEYDYVRIDGQNRFENIQIKLDWLMAETEENQAFQLGHESDRDALLLKRTTPLSG